MNRALALTALLLLAAPACHGDKNAVLLIVVTASGTPPTVSSLDVVVTSRAGPSTNRYAHDGPDPITFPTTLSAELPAYATGDVGVDVRAEDASGATVATGSSGSIVIRPGESKTVYVRLDCGGAACIVDGGVGNPDGGQPSTNPRCGNGRVDPGETCDTAIAPTDPGGCPVSCDDHIPCTRDSRNGGDCTATCAHDPILKPAQGDGCCPAGSGPAVDSDCSKSCGNGVVDPGETCDMGISHGMLGACPATADCLPVPCAEGVVISLNTCSAVCAWNPIVTPSGKDHDSCCPPGASAGTDIDCLPVCGDGVWDQAGGEACDVGIPAGTPGGCPTTCDDGDTCTIDYFLTKGCQAACGHTKIVKPIAGDGCCPDGATNATDSDCAPVCGNGVVERGERCDGDCPTSCPRPPPDVIGRPGCLFNEIVGDPNQCTTHCEVRVVSACNPDYKDGCCPDDCTAAEDPDCSRECGDALLRRTLGEECETGAPAGVAGSCPTSCNDHNPCTDDYLVSAGTCSARCVYLPVTESRPGDGCCLPGVTFYIDPDCPAQCGNGVVDGPSEFCDYGYGAGCPDPDTCRSNDACTIYTVTGRADNCSAACVATPVGGCVDDDKCCPAGCTAVNDDDCPAICGDGVVETSETCDRAITAGKAGACDRTCDDGDACTIDQAGGSVESCSRTCSHVPIIGCIGNDGCCPAACSPATDSDCAPTCGDKRVGAGETCDPPSACPTVCPDDGDRCTTEQLTGSAAACNAACRHVPVTACSGTKADRCCPTGCTHGTDTDC